MGDGLVAAAELALGDVGGAEEGGDADAGGARGVGLGDPGADADLVPAEALEGAVEPLARRGVIGVEFERALGVEGGLVGAAEAVEDLEQAHVLVGLGLGGREQAEALLPHGARGLDLAHRLEQADQLVEDAARGRRRLGGARRGAGEQAAGVDGHGGALGPRALAGDRGAELVDEHARRRVEQPRGAVVVALVIGLGGERLDEIRGAVVANEVPREGAAHRPGRRLEGHRALEGDERRVGLPELAIEHVGALDVDPRGEAAVPVAAIGVSRGGGA